MGWTRVGISVGLAIATLALYAPCSHFEFVRFDDYEYVVDNPHIQNGITLDTVRWAFTKSYEANWHPLTWLSHALDIQLFGKDPSGHHFVNVILHAGNAVLLFVLLTRSTGSIWKSAFVAHF